MTGTPRTDALVAEWGNDAAVRGVAFTEICALARELEQSRDVLAKALMSIAATNHTTAGNIADRALAKAGIK